MGIGPEKHNRAPTPGGIDAVLRECDECAPLEWSLDDM